MSHGFAGFVRSLAPSNQEDFRREAFRLLKRMDENGAIRLRGGRSSIPPASLGEAYRARDPWTTFRGGGPVTPAKWGNAQEACRHWRHNLGCLGCLPNGSWFCQLAGEFQAARMALRASRLSSRFPDLDTTMCWYLAWITYSAPTVRGTKRGRGNVLGWAPLPPPSQTVPSPALGRLFDSLAAASRPG